MPTSHGDTGLSRDAPHAPGDQAQPSANAAGQSDASELVRLDPSLIAGLRELGGDEFSELVHLFLDDGALRVAALRVAERAGDAALMGKIAHSLKGSAATFGAEALAECCRELQALAASSEQSALAGLVDSVDAGFARATDALRYELSIT